MPTKAAHQSAWIIILPFNKCLKFATLAAGTQLVMDSGALVGSIAPDMNTALGTIAIRGGRR